LFLLHNIIQKNIMESLETKKKRLKFLKELQSRGLESGTGQIKRTELDIAFIEFSISLEKRRAEREIRIDNLLKNK
jgi:hypothetical protein